MTPDDVLRGARDLIREEGWTTETFYDGSTGGYCVVGALRKAAGGLVVPWYGDVDMPVDNVKSYDEARNRISFAVGDMHIVEWNDDSSRTVDDVITILEEVMGE